MAGYDRQAVLKEIEPYLSEEELENIEEQARLEREGSIPKHDYLAELYGAFEGISRDCMTEQTEAIGLLTAMREKEDREEILETISRQIRQGVRAIEESRKEILHDRKTLAELKRISG